MLESEEVKDCIKDIYGAHSILLSSWEIVLPVDGAEPFPLVSRSPSLSVLQVASCSYRSNLHFESFNFE